MNCASYRHMIPARAPRYLCSYTSFRTSHSQEEATGCATEMVITSSSTEHGIKIRQRRGTAEMKRTAASRNGTQGSYMLRVLKDWMSWNVDVFVETLLGEGIPASVTMIPWLEFSLKHRVCFRNCEGGVECWSTC